MKHPLVRRLTIVLILTFSLLAGLFVLPAAAGDGEPTVWDGTVASAFEGGSGTESDPYLIADGAQLAYLSALISEGVTGNYATACYALTADILLNDTSAVNAWATNAPPHAWTPIGVNADRPFSGRFDGRGHSIDGLYMKSTVDREYSGLFGYTVDAEISHLRLNDGYMYGVLILGSVVGEAHTTTVTDVHNDGVSVTCVKTRDHVHASIHCVTGGLVGRAYEGCRIEGCSVSAGVSASNTSNTSGSKTLQAMAGGVVAITVGTQAAPVVIRDCSVGGNVYASNNHDYQTSYAGGVVGNATYTIASGCVIEGGRIEGASTGNSYSGGVFGTATNGQAISCIIASDVLTSNGNKSGGCAAGGIAGSFGNGASLNSFGNRAENCIVTGTVKTHNVEYPRYGVLVGNIGNNSYVAYNFYVPAEGADEDDKIITAIHGAKGSSGVTVTENFTVTAEQLAGTSSAAIAAESAYADTPSVMIAMNRFVKAYNRSDTVTLDQGETRPVVYRYYTMHKGVTFQGTEHGSATFAVMENPFPASSGVTPEGGAVGGLFGFTVEANPGYVLRSVTYVYEGISTTTLQPDAASRYSFVLPAVDVTVQLNFVEEGADVFSITYIDCEEVSVWSDYNPRAHFKGYETPIPTPTRPDYHFRGWVVNGAGPAVMDLTLGADDYSANITLTATWEAKELVVLSFDTQTPTYNGEPQAFVLSGASAGLSGIVVTYEIDDVFGADLPVNAGTYRVRIYRAEDATYQKLDRLVTLRIELAPSSVIIPTSVSRPYNNAPMDEPVVETVGDGEVSFHWYERGSVTELESAPKLVGLYTLVVRIAQGENYAAAQASQDFEISRATIDPDTFGWNYSDPFTYDGSEKTVSVIGLPSDVTIHYGSTRSATNAGTYTASATFELDLTNYNPITIDDLTWTVERAVIDDMTLRWVVSDFVYNGAEKSVSLTGLPSDVTVTLSGNTAVNAGTYTATAQFSYDTNNYESVSVAPLSWTIRRATIPTDSIRWSATAFTFDGGRKTVTVTGVPAGLTPHYSGNSYIAAGTYRAVVSFEGDYSNYEPVSPMVLDWQIDRADSIISGDVYQSAVYDGTPKAPQADLNHSEAAIVCLEDLPTETGVYNLTLYVPASPNYNEATRVVRLTISKGDDALIDEMIEHITIGYYSDSLLICRQELNAAYDCYKLINDKTTERVSEAVDLFGFLVEYYNAKVADVNNQMAQANMAVLTAVHPLMPNVVVRRFASEIEELYK